MNSPDVRYVRGSDVVGFSVTNLTVKVTVSSTFSPGCSDPVSGHVELLLGVSKQKQVIKVQLLFDHYRDQRGILGVDDRMTVEARLEHDTRLGNMSHDPDQGILKHYDLSESPPVSATEVTLATSEALNDSRSSTDEVRTFEWREWGLYIDGGYDDRYPPLFEMVLGSYPVLISTDNAVTFMKADLNFASTYLILVMGELALAWCMYYDKSDVSLALPSTLKLEGFAYNTSWRTALGRINPSDGDGVSKIQFWIKTAEPMGTETIVQALREHGVSVEHGGLGFQHTSTKSPSNEDQKRATTPASTAHTGVATFISGSTLDANLESSGVPPTGHVKVYFDEKYLLLTEPGGRNLFTIRLEDVRSLGYAWPHIRLETKIQTAGPIDYGAHLREGRVYEHLFIELRAEDQAKAEAIRSYFYLHVNHESIWETDADEAVVRSRNLQMG
jgi:hypothetical protein